MNDAKLKSTSEQGTYSAISDVLMFTKAGKRDKSYSFSFIPLKQPVQEPFADLPPRVLQSTKEQVKFSPNFREKYSASLNFLMNFVYYLFTLSPSITDGVKP